MSREEIPLKGHFASVEWLTPHLPPPVFLSDLVAAEGSTLGDAIAFPGLINSHDHLAFNCYPPTGSPPYRDFLEWSRDVQTKTALIESIERIPHDVRVQFGALKNLLWGVTTVADHGGRKVRCDLPITILPHRALHSPELEKWGPLKLLLGTDMVVAHLAEGVDESSRERALGLLNWNRLRRPVVGVHCISMRNTDFTKLAALIWCPASNEFLFGRTANVAQALARISLLFGTDSTLSAPGDLWTHLRAARSHLSANAVLSSLTAEAIRFWRLPSSYSANNFVLARRGASSAVDSFFATTPRDILLVVRDRQPVLTDSTLIKGPSLLGFETVACEGTFKYVKLPLNAMVQAATHSSPDFDSDALVERFCASSS